MDKFWINVYDLLAMPARGSLGPVLGGDNIQVPKPVAKGKP